MLPLFTHLGVEVTDERPYEVPGPDGRTLHIFDFGLCADAQTWGSGDAALAATSASASRRPSGRSGTAVPSPTASTRSCSRPG